MTPSPVFYTQNSLYMDEVHYYTPLDLCANLSKLTYIFKILTIFSLTHATEIIVHYE